MGGINPDSGGGGTSNTGNTGNNGNPGGPGGPMGPPPASRGAGNYRAWEPEDFDQEDTIKLKDQDRHQEQFDQSASRTRRNYDSELTTINRSISREGLEGALNGIEESIDDATQQVAAESNANEGEVRPETQSNEDRSIDATDEVADNLIEENETSEFEGQNRTDEDPNNS